MGENHKLIQPGRQLVNETTNVATSTTPGATASQKRRLRLLDHLLRSVAVATALAAVSVSAQAPLDVRVALIIGNSAYANAPLLNPANDAQAMSDVLRRLGFQVVELRDGSKTQMSAAIGKMSDTLKGKQGVGMLYYAGHGLQLDWRNYMVPVDAKLQSAADVPMQAIELSSVVDMFKAAGNRMNIVVLDACRDNPFGKDTSTAKGLAQLDAPPSTFLAYATAPGNVAEDGDEKSGNGLYTQFLLQELKRPTAKIEDVFKRVRLNVRKQSQGRQIPWESTSLEDDFFFNDGVKYTIKPEELARMAAGVAAAVAEKERLIKLAEQARAQEIERVAAVAAAAVIERERQVRLAEQAKAQEAERAAAVVNAAASEKERLVKLAEQARAREAERLVAVASAAAIEKDRQARLAEQAKVQGAERTAAVAAAAAIEKARLAQVAELAKAQEAERLIAISRVNEQRLSKEQQKELAFKEAKAAWDRIKGSANPEDFYSFLQRFPTSGELTEMAEYRLDQLSKPKITAAVGKGQDASLGYTGDRFKVGDRFEFQLSDVLTNLPGEKYTQRVTSIEGDIVHINNGNFIVTQLGAGIKNQRGTYDPPVSGLPVEFQVGKKWGGRSTQTGADGNIYELQYDTKVVGREAVTVPAGTFQTYKLVRTVFVSGGPRPLALTITFWVDPRYGLPIKSEEIGRANGQLMRSDRRELIALKADRS